MRLTVFSIGYLALVEASSTFLRTTQASGSSSADQPTGILSSFITSVRLPAASPVPAILTDDGVKSKYSTARTSSVSQKTTKALTTPYSAITAHLALQSRGPETSGGYISSNPAAAKTTSQLSSGGNPPSTSTKSGSALVGALSHLSFTAVSRLPPTKTAKSKTRETEIGCAPWTGCGGGKKCSGGKRSISSNVTLVNNNDNLQDTDDYVPKDNEGLVSSGYILFGNKAHSLVVHGLYGCTSVIAVSRRGAWANHIWENPIFGSPFFLNEETGTFDWESQTVYFDNYGLKPTIIGDGLDNPLNSWGLVDLANNPDIGPQGTMFDSESHPRIFIMTPRPLVDPIRPNGERTSDEERMDINANAGQQRYLYLIARLVWGIRQAWGEDVPVEIVDYAPRVESNKWLDDKQTASPEVEEQMQKDRAERMEDKTDTRGRVQIQYQPARDCLQKASWSVLVEARGAQGREESWYPQGGQILPDQGGQGRAQRRAECPSNSSEHQTSTKTTTGHSTTNTATSSAVCKAHIQEINTKDATYADITLTDGAGAQIANHSQQIQVGGTITIPPKPLPYEVRFDFRESGLARGRLPPGSNYAMLYQGYDLVIQAGDWKWLSGDTAGLPSCNAGGWDIHGTRGTIKIADKLVDVGDAITRYMDCMWPC
ncbi:hypothetical protein QQS21_011040 [Conoideocrella luteorostrata]|uniref:Uncharacterized protein n=1 Tax=Conoideocrella luteorostrata TaxID=1105319 RepID=A0AAJ0CGL0_9HYPO|nr:hypothetical protein QQS21_011040 [Conoideocrella luteorostrata]